jgi:hypothetical protein
VFVRPPYDGPTRIEPMLTGALRVSRVEVGLSAGVALPVRLAIPRSDGDGTLTLLVFPARITLGVPLALGSRLALTPAVAGGFDLVLGETRGIGTTRRSSAIEPVAEAGLAFRAALTRRFWFDLQAFQGIDLRPEEFVVTDPNTQADVTVLMTPRTYTRVGANFGFFLGNSGKN